MYNEMIEALTSISIISVYLFCKLQLKSGSYHLLGYAHNFVYLRHVRHKNPILAGLLHLIGYNPADTRRDAMPISY